MTLLGCALGLIAWVSWASGVGNDGAASGAQAPAAQVVPAAEEVDFARDVRPLLARRCFACHGNDESTRAAGLRLDVREEAVRLRGKYAALVPGGPDESELWLRVTDEADPMPPHEAGEPLSPDELDVLRRWIEAGAPYAEHWSFVAPARPEVPAASDRAWLRTPVDAFIAARLEREGLAPSPEADPATLLRRVSLDLTGLPPTVAEAHTFLAEVADGGLDEAYARAVERLLASPHYGERWAAMWLDLARYADSAGHGSDPLRTIWRYRDWVIDAYDKNMPLDEFGRLQLAGDLIEDATPDTQLATAFHRNTMTNTEGGTDDEEFRVLAVKDRVNTTGQVFLGLSVGCAECHSHKYDPLSQREYYELFDFFNQTADTDQNDDRPRLATPTAAQAAALARIEADLAAVDGEMAAFEPDLAAGAARLRAAEARWAPAFAVVDRTGAEHTLALGGGPWARPASAEGARTDVFDLHGVGARPTALRLRAWTSDELPRGGPGQSPDNGNFVVTDLRVDEAFERRALSLAPRRVRIELAGAGRILSLAEVEVLDGDGVNVALRGVASQSSTDFQGPAAHAIDGDTSGAFDDASVTHTRTEADPWWQVELEHATRVTAIHIWNRTDGDLEARLEGLRVVMFDDEGRELWRAGPFRAPRPSLALDLTDGAYLPVGLGPATASFEQSGFNVGLAIDTSPTSGWAIGPRQGAPHEAVFALSPSSGFGRIPGSDTLRVTIAQGFGGAHTLGRVSLETTDAAPPPRALGVGVRRALERDAADWDDADRAALREHLLGDEPQMVALRARRAALVKERADLDVVTTPIMVELVGDRRRATHVLHKGNFLEPGERVRAATPVALHPFGAREHDRLGLAEWLFDAANPLTARVTVNRLWARLFGRGLVLTENDFGAQGEQPTHPELLDWLAVELREGGWDQHALLRTLVLSSTYRQASRVTPELAQRDPAGVLYARYPRQRLEAEMVRDAALSAAGLLSDKKFGPSVFPPQPAGLWQAAFNGERDWQESMGEDRWRRGLYVFLRRTTPYPMLTTFDAPSREVCTLKRPRTNTPLQAFVTLNDPVFSEASQALGRVLAAEAAAGGDRAGVELALWRVTQRPPYAAQVDALSALLTDARAGFAADEAGARLFAEALPGASGPPPLGPLPQDLGPVEAAAWTLVASVALNLDAALTKD
ncbi:MAG: DUF1553 domain-containing protein [Planctomycetota bacterium]